MAQLKPRHPRVVYFRIDPDLYRELRIVSLEKNLPVAALLCGAARYLSDTLRDTRENPIIALARTEKEAMQSFYESKRASKASATAKKK